MAAGNLNDFEMWRMCLKKKKLQKKWADNIIKRADTPLRKYLCPYCNKYHVTSKKNHKLGNHE